MPLMVEAQLIRIARVIMLELELWMIRPKDANLCVYPSGGRAISKTTCVGRTLWIWKTAGGNCIPFCAAASMTCWSLWQAAHSMLATMRNDAAPLCSWWQTEQERFFITFG
jgi:hypothetical protein